MKYRRLENTLRSYEKFLGIDGTYDIREKKTIKTSCFRVLNDWYETKITTSKNQGGSNFGGLYKSKEEISNAAKSLLGKLTDSEGEFSRKKIDNISNGFYDYHYDPLKYNAVHFKGHYTFGCESCSRIGSFQCNQCNGHGKKYCPTCNGSGTTVCRSCHGNGRNDMGNSYCGACSGSGNYNCDNCAGRQIVSCSTCASEGRLVCRNCGGYGELSECWTGRVESHANFTYKNKDDMLFNYIDSHFILTDDDPIKQIAINNKTEFKKLSISQKKQSFCIISETGFYLDIDSVIFFEKASGREIKINAITGTDIYDFRGSYNPIFEICTHRINNNELDPSFFEESPVSNLLDMGKEKTKKVLMKNNLAYSEVISSFYKSLDLFISEKKLTADVNFIAVGLVIISTLFFSLMPLALASTTELYQNAAARGLLDSFISSYIIERVYLLDYKSSLIVTFSIAYIAIAFFILKLINISIYRSWIKKVFILFFVIFPFFCSANLLAVYIDSNLSIYKSINLINIKNLLHSLGSDKMIAVTFLSLLLS